METIKLLNNLMLFRHNKEADIFVTRDDDFHASWLVDDVIISVEYIPENSPSIVLIITDYSKDEFEKLEDNLKRIGFKSGTHP